MPGRHVKSAECANHSQGERGLLSFWIAVSALMEAPLRINNFYPPFGLLDEK